MEKEDTELLLHDMKQTNKNSFFSPSVIIIFVAALIVGIGSGYLLSKTKSNGIPLLGSGSGTGGIAAGKGTVVGSNDLKTFKDSAEGVLQQGGIDGEGQYHLVRPGGDSQNVYMTSSIVDLSTFVGKKVKVWGQTNTAQKAGWLMDIGRVEVLE